MTKSIRIGQKIKRLVALAARWSSLTDLDGYCHDLLDTNTLNDTFNTGASCLNNDGVPLQLSFTTAPNGVSLRLIGDPGAYHQDVENRFQSSIQTLHFFMDQSVSEDFKSIAQKTIKKLIPQTAQERTCYKQGFVWIGANPKQAGIAFYLELAPLGYERGWQTTELWLQDILPDTSVAFTILKKIKKYGIIASAGLEGSTLENTRAKLYFRFKEATSLKNLDIDLFNSQEMQDFLTIAMARFEVDLQGFVMNIGFNLMTGALADVKVDLCGHCLRHTPDAWQDVMNQLTNRFSLAPLDTKPILENSSFEVAFIGFGLTADIKPRLNLYIKHGMLTEAPETDEIWAALKDAMYYLQSIQNEDGSWHDYHLPVGKSDQWVTAYAGHALAQYGNRSNNVEAIEAATKAANWLKQNQTYASGWGYNQKTGPDADSTALSIALFDELGMDVFAKDRIFLKDHWEDGGCIATYDGPNAWGKGHWDVTPWGYYGMLDDDKELLSPQFMKALYAQRLHSGYWRSYWWKKPFYSTFITLEVLEKLGVAEPEYASLNVSEPLTIDNAFDLACYIGIACLRNHSNEKMGSYMRTLLNWQLKNGSWQGSSNLRVTENYCYAPWEEPIGVYYQDEKSVVSTATIIRVLSRIICSQKKETQEILYHWL